MGARKKEPVRHPVTRIRGGGQRWVRKRKRAGGVGARMF